MSTRTYSSYQLDEFQRCPKLWDLKHRWKEPDTGFNVNMALGWAVSAGLACMRRGDSNLESTVTEALREKWQDNDEWAMKGLMKQALNGVRLGMSTNLNLKSYLAIDNKLYGRCRPDVVGRTPEGQIRIVDDKLKVKLDLKYLDEALAEFQVSNQLYEYTWEVGRHYGEPVTSVGINLIILSPKPTAVFYPMTLTEEAVEYWARGATADFDEMSLIESALRDPRTRWTSCRSKYNKPGTFEKALCPMWVLCHDLAGDESKAGAFFGRK